MLDSLGEPVGLEAQLDFGWIEAIRCAAQSIAAAGFALDVVSALAERTDVFPDLGTRDA
jgi:hypothetical protein